MKHITLFETATAYNAATLDLPNVSLIEETMSVGYKPYVPETRLVAKYNVTDTSNPTKLWSGYVSNAFKSMEVDGVQLNEVVTEYTFNTTGEHTVKYELYDETKLGDNAPLFYNDNLISVVIPDTVTNISGYTFLNTQNIISVIMGNNITTIGDSAFQYCNNLINIQLPNSLTSIGNSAFYECHKINIQLPNSLTSIGSQTFYRCINIENITIPDSVTSISSNAFGETYISQSKFINNSSIDETTNNYWGCTILDSDNDGLLIKNNKVMLYRGNSSNVIIPEGVTQINDYIFKYCANITNIVSITIPNTINYISSNAFNGIIMLKDNFINNNYTYNYPWGGIFYDTNINGLLLDNNVIIKYIGNESNLIIPDSVTGIGKSAFNDYRSLTSIYIPDSVTSIGDYAFYYCTGLTSINIPDSVTSIGNYAFSYCRNLPIENNIRYADTYAIEVTDKTLSSYTIKNGTKWINERCFNSCKNLTSIILPDSIIDIHHWAFEDCINLENITSYAINAPSISRYTFDGVKNNGTLTVPSGSTGYDAWMSTDDYYLGKYNWTKVEQ